MGPKTDELNRTIRLVLCARRHIGPVCLIPDNNYVKAPIPAVIARLFQSLLKARHANERDLTTAFATAW